MIRANPSTSRSEMKNNPISIKIFFNKLTRCITLLYKAIFHQRGLDFNGEMRDRLLVLLLLGVGVIKVYEEYDEEEKDERDPMELIKHKHSKRDLDAVEKTVSSPVPIEEETIEATSRGLSPRLRVKCKDIEDECSCKATAILFAKLGACVALVARDKSRLEETRQACIQISHPDVYEKHKEPFLCIEADLAEPCEVEKAYRLAINHFHQLDILVNNAGCMIRDTVESFNATEYEHMMKVNVTAAITLTNLAIPDLSASKGSIVNVSSVCGKRSFPGVMSYCISKAALDQFTKCTALDLAPKGIRVNSVNPAVIVTELHRRSGMSENDYEKFLSRANETHALGRTGTVEEVARAIAFLSSSASSFTTGNLLMVDGGRSIMCPR
uniref:Tropinone reductase 2 n=1 Tax=Schistosoma haematobium TaxID=6185 RepID=A0A095BZ75_SCHHA